jgi:hypothetical protein
MNRFREIWKWLVPGWLQEGDGELVQYTEGVMLDAFQESCHQTAKLMLPSVCVSDALARIGADRAIPRGFAEPDASYRERLRRWRYPRGHRIRGNAPGLLEQVEATLAGTIHQTIDVRGTRYTHDTDGAERGVTWDWDGVALTPNWGRFWIVVKSAGTLPLTWDEDEAAGTLWDEGDDVCWAGEGIHPGELQAVKRLCQVGRLSWVPAGRRPIYLVIWFDGETYPAPDGTWDEWGNRPVDMHAFEPLHPSIT